MWGLDFGLAVLVTGGILGVVDEGLWIEIAAGRGELPGIEVKSWGVEGALGHVGVGGSMETLGSVGGDESAIAGEVSGPW
jgi:hypothetical protein